MRLQSKFNHSAPISPPKAAKSRFFLGSLLACTLGISSFTAYGADAAQEKKAKMFSHDTVVELAQQLAQKPFKEARKAPKELIDLDYATYGKINYQENAAIWGGTPTKFSVQLFAPGFLYKNLVDIDV
ncbi:MAG: glucan biosynthesis protein, partial [Shewanella sp.]